MNGKKMILKVIAATLALSACSGPLADNSIAQSIDRYSRDSRTILPAPTTTSSALQNNLDPRLVAGYIAEIKYRNDFLGTQGLTLHYGFNNWQNVKDLPLNLSAGGQESVTPISIPTWATSLDYAVYTVGPSGMRIWDNNGSFDFHVPIYQAVTLVSLFNGKRSVGVITTLDSPILHYGNNGWQNITESAMTRDEYLWQAFGVKKYTAVLSGLAPEDSLDYCFRDQNGNWLNNGGSNWYQKSGTGLIDVWPTDFQSSIYYQELVGLPIKAFLNGAFWGSSNLSLTHSGAYFGATFSQAPYGDQNFILDTMKDGYRYYGKASARVTAYGTHIYLGITKTALK